MQKRNHNLFHQVKQQSRWLVYVLLFAMTVPAPRAHAVSKSKLIGTPAFAALVVVIARLNQAMRSAAENPQDEFRRRNVRTALQALPPAIIGLAQVFKSGKLHNADLPMVQSLLGGFVDVNAADKYKQFMNKPDASLIPRVGADLPANLMNVPEESGSGSRQALGFDDSASRGGNTNGASIGKDPYAEAVEAAPGQYAERSPASIPVPISSSGSGTDSGSSRGFGSDDMFAARAEFKAQAQTPSTPVGMVRDNAGLVRSNMADATRDLAAVEEQEVRSAALQTQSSLDEDLMPKKERSNNGTVNPRSYRINKKEKFWQFGRLLHQAEALLIHDAHAGEECEDCAGGGGGGGGGGDAAGILFGLAAIAAAIVPAIVAGIQADADKKIAHEQAEAQKYMTDKTNENSRALAQLQQQTAIQTASMQAEVAQKNNEGVTQRLESQLASMERARDQAAQAEQQRQQLEYEYNQQRIQLAQRQADQNLQVARATLSAQLTQAGLSQGTTSQSNSVAITPSNAVASTDRMASSAGASLQGGSGVGFREGGNADSTQILTENGSIGSRIGSSAGSTSALAAISSNSTNAVMPVNASSGGQRLLASLDSRSSTSRGFASAAGVGASNEEEEEGERRSVKRRDGVTTLRTVAAAGSGSSLLLGALRGLKSVGGSSRKAVAKPAVTAVASTSAVSGSANGDLAKFMNSGKPAARGFADYQQHQATSRGIASVPAAVAGSGHSAAYRAP